MKTSYSVLMPLAPWESPAIVSEALQSLSSQTLQPAQVIVSCDGPPSEGLRNLLLNSDLPLEILLGPGREGVGPVLARGLRSCNHELVVRADSDDISLPTRCEKQLNTLQAMEHVVALSAAIEEFTTNRAIAPRIRRVPISAKEICRMSLWRNPLNHPAVVLRRSGVEAVGSYRSRPGFEDYDLWLRLLKRWGPNALGNLQDVLVLARVGTEHLARRHGADYARKECLFLLGCARQGLLPGHQALILLITRVPLRILPSPLMKWLMHRFRHEAQVDG